MSVSLFTKEEITRSTINKSTAKYMFSFSKAERFPSFKRKGYCDTFYNLPSVAMKRNCSFGIGNRYDFTKRGKGCNAEFYNVKRDFDEGKLIGLKYSFGICREKYAKVYYETNKYFDKNIPGPGKYSVVKPLGYDALKFTMGPRLNTDAGSGSKYNVTPGPGTYAPVIKINEKGKYPSSKIKNITLSDFGITKTNNMPAPNAYNLKPLLGKVFDSRHKSSQDKSMLARFKTIDSRENYPGPGSYIAFSEFGMYISKKEAERRKNFASTDNIKNNNNTENNQQQTTKEETVPSKENEELENKEEKNDIMIEDPHIEDKKDNPQREPENNQETIQTRQDEHIISSIVNDPTIESDAKAKNDVIIEPDAKPQEEIKESQAENNNEEFKEEL